MRRRFLSSCIGVGLVIAAGVTLATPRYTVSEPIYTVAQVRATLLRAPRRLMGRAIYVRGTLQGPFIFCLATRPCPVSHIGLVDDGNGVVGPGQYLPLQERSATGLLVFFYNLPLARHLPLVEAILPAPQRLHFGLTALYRLRLQGIACGGRPRVPCYEGVLLNVAPVAS